MSIAERLWDLEEGGAGSLETLGHALILQGRIRLSDAEWSQAYDAFERAASIWESLLASDPENLKRMKQLAAAQAWLGSCCRKLYDTKQAVPHYERAAELRRELVRRQPDVPETALALIGAQINLAVAHMDLEIPEAEDKAADLLAEAERQLRHLHDAGQVDGLERWYSRRIEAIRANQAILQRRAEQPAGETSPRP